MVKSKAGNRRSKGNKNLVPLFIMAVGIIGLAIWVIVTATSPEVENSHPVAAQEVNGVQEIYLDISAAGYSPNIITVKEGIPVKIITDSTADAGCVRGFMAKDFDLNVALDIGKDSFTFTPNKKGTFKFTCQMKMSSGTITVV